MMVVLGWRLCPPIVKGASTVMGISVVVDGMNTGLFVVVGGLKGSNESGRSSVG
jgi:hypothetical protein